MKYILILLLFLSGVSQAREYKAVFDCSSKNASYIMSRMFLIERTIDMIEKNGDSVKFALTIHGNCAPVVSRNFDEVIVDENDLVLVEKAQKQIIKLANEKKVEVVVCAMSLNANAIAEEDVLPFVYISENSFIDTIGYQNDGYALMTFK